MVNIKINGQSMEVSEESSVLEAAQEAGIWIPTLCFHKELSPYGACRICLVEITEGGRPGVKASCLLKATEGLAVDTNSDKVKHARKIMLELMLSKCPDSEEIKAVAEKCGVSSTRIESEEKTDCILCGLCVRACAEVSQRYAISFANRGVKRKVMTPFDRVSKPCIGCKACEYVCPTHCITIEDPE